MRNPDMVTGMIGMQGNTTYLLICTPCVYQVLQYSYVISNKQSYIGIQFMLCIAVKHI